MQRLKSYKGGVRFLKLISSRIPLKTNKKRLVQSMSQKYPKRTITLTIYLK